MKIKLSKTLHAEMSGGAWAQQEEPDLFHKITVGEPLTEAELPVVRDGVETALIGIQGVRGGAILDFEEGRDLAAAERSARALLKRLG